MMARSSWILPALFLFECGDSTPVPQPPPPPPTLDPPASAAPSASAAPAPSASASAAAATPAGPPHFSYSGDDGPDKWGSLDASFATCASGTHQSPIDLPAKPAASKDKPLGRGKYDPFPLKILNNGHTVQVNDSASSTFTIDGVAYSLAQFHFHVPSEHTIAGAHFDAEAHFVHKSADGKLAVIGVMMKKGKENKALAAVIDHAPPEKMPETNVDGAPIDVTQILPAHPKYDRYDGSLTTPPCTEGVSWLVIPPSAGVIEVSDAQLAKLSTAVHGNNSRPVQPLQGRSVVEAK